MTEKGLKKNDMLKELKKLYHSWVFDGTRPVGLGGQAIGSRGAIRIAYHTRNLPTRRVSKAILQLPT